MAGRACSVCAHPDAVEINEALVIAGASNRAIASQYELSKDSIRRHREHIPKLLVKASEAEGVTQADALLAEVRSLKDRTGAILDKAEEGGELKLALSAIRELRGNLELLARLLGELTEGATVNIVNAPQWVEILGGDPRARGLRP